MSGRVGRGHTAEPPNGGAVVAKQRAEKALQELQSCLQAPLVAGTMASRPNAMMQTFAVTVPAGVGPGQQFQASLDGQLTMVIVPHGSGPQSTLHVQIPVRPSSVQKYAVTVPQGIQPGSRFQANLGGQLVWLTCPRNLGPGKQMLVDASTSSTNGGTAKSWPPPIGVPEELDGARPSRTGSPRSPCPPPHASPSAGVADAPLPCLPARQASHRAHCPAAPRRPPRCPPPRTPPRTPSPVLRAPVAHRGAPDRICGRANPAGAGKEIPEYFLCPITGCLMRQPAMTPDGVTYDHDAIVEWLQNKQTDPSTNQPLSIDQLCPNRTVRRALPPCPAPCALRPLRRGLPHPWAGRLHARCCPCSGVAGAQHDRGLHRQGTQLPHDDIERSAGLAGPPWSASELSLSACLITARPSGAGHGTLTRLMCSSLWMNPVPTARVLLSSFA